MHEVVCVRLTSEMVTAQARRLRDFGRVAHKGWYSVIDVSRTHVFFPSRVFSATAEPWSGRAQLLDGRLHAARWKLEIAESIARQTRTRFATTPVLRQWSSVIGPTRYCTSVEKEKRVSKQVCVSFEHLPGDVEQQTVLDVLQRLNADKQIHGIILQLPSRRN